jgi:hypothetical protein
MSDDKFYATLILKVAVNREPEDSSADTVDKLMEAVKKFEFNGELDGYCIEDYDYRR